MESQNAKIIVTGVKGGMGKVKTAMLLPSLKDNRDRLIIDFDNLK